MIPIAQTPVEAKKRRILVVDDHAASTRVVKLFLEGTNDYLVREENQPTVALASALEFRPDLILMDVMMPSMDGGELAARIRAEPTLASVPIVFLTATIRRAEAVRRGLRAGGHAFLAKPMVLTDVLACIRKQLST